MSAETTSGLAAQTGMTAQSGRPSMLGALAAGGTARNGPGYIHNLHLELGSPRTKQRMQAVIALQAVYLADDARLPHAWPLSATIRQPTQAGSR